MSQYKIRFISVSYNLNKEFKSALSKYEFDRIQYK